MQTFLLPAALWSIVVISLAALALQAVVFLTPGSKRALDLNATQKAAAWVAAALLALQWSASLAA